MIYIILGNNRGLLKFLIWIYYYLEKKIDVIFKIVYSESILTKVLVHVVRIFFLKKCDVYIG